MFSYLIVNYDNKQVLYQNNNIEIINNYKQKLIKENKYNFDIILIGIFNTFKVLYSYDKK